MDSPQNGSKFLLYCKSALKLHNLAFVPFFTKSPLEWDPKSVRLKSLTSNSDGRAIFWKVAQILGIGFYALLLPFAFYSLVFRNMDLLQCMMWCTQFVAISFHLACGKRFVTGIKELATAVNGVLDMQAQLILSNKKAF